MKHVFILLGIIAGIMITSCGGSKKAIPSKVADAIEENEPLKVAIEEVKVMKEEVKVMKEEVKVIKEEVKVIKEEAAMPKTPEKPTMVEAPVIQKTTTELQDAPEPVVVKVMEDKEIMINYPNHSTFNKLLAAHVSPQGNVSYSGFKNNWSTLRAYIKDLGAKTPTDKWTREDKLAYWMNAYNAMTIDLILRNQPIESIKDIKDPWDQRLWKLGSKWYNLNEIEHQILRKMGDARIHFGINCASFSCPPLLNKAFTADKVETQLDALSRAFVNDKKRNTITENSIEISKIFTWFAKDFKTNGTLIDFLNKYSEVPISPNAKKRSKDYIWTLNK